MNTNKNILAKELHKPVRTRFVKRRINTYGIDDLWAIDLMDMIQFSKMNKGYKYIFVVIDTFSKILWLQEMKGKSGLEASETFRKIIKRSKRVPKFIHADKGKEFVNKHFQKLLIDLNITMYHTENLEKSSIVERVIRTIKHKLKLLFEVNSNKIWYNKLPSIEFEYNNSHHRSIKMKPSEVSKENESFVYNNLFPKADKLKPLCAKFKIGDRVRITKYKSTFMNKFSNNWTREIFVISKIEFTQPVTYRIQDLNGEEIGGSFYNEDLQKTVF